MRALRSLAHGLLAMLTKPISKINNRTIFMSYPQEIPTTRCPAVTSFYNLPSPLGMINCKDFDMLL